MSGIGGIGGVPSFGVTGDDAVEAAGAIGGGEATLEPTAPDVQAFVDRAEQIVRMQDAPLRNLHITQGYFEVSNLLREGLGIDDANWCTFAQWASRQAGRTIRKEDVPWASALVHLVNDTLGRFVDSAVDRASRSIARGNLIVFQELAPVLARFGGFIRNLDAPDDARLEAFIARTVKPGHVRTGGQAMLGDAMRAYYHAKFEEDPEKRAELMLLGSALIGLHEQIRLQPEIEGAFPLGAARIATHTLMELESPGERLDLSDDIPTRNGRMFPMGLETIENAALQGVLAAYDLTPNTTRGSGAGDWTRLVERMNYIFDLFRSRQDDRALFEQPLTASERSRLDVPTLGAPRDS